MSHAAARLLQRPSFANALGDAKYLRAMLDFEAAMAMAQSDVGVIPTASAAAIELAARSLDPDVEALVAAGKSSASLAVPLVDALREAVRSNAPDAALHVHLGTTSQDVLDTAMALCLKPCLDEADAVLRQAVSGLARRAREHRATPMLGRTLLQPALPFTAGLKIARWAAALEGDRARLAGSRATLAVQCGGPVGALEALGGRGPAVRANLARRLGLADAISWHAHRSEWLDLHGRITQVVITVGKIALDVALLSQAEVGEMREAPPQAGVGASSAMAHKRNPAGCARALAAATRAPALLAAIQAGALAEHERALGGWQAELATVPELAHALGTSLDFIEGLAHSLVVDADRMRINLESSKDICATDPAAAKGLDVALDELLREIER